VPGNGLLTVEVLGVSHVKNIEAMGERPLGLRDANEMDMVRHQAIRPNIDGIAIGVFLKPTQIMLIVLGIFEDCLSIVTTLGHLVWKSNDCGAG
jgi:hypothetical protein